MNNKIKKQYCIGYLSPDIDDTYFEKVKPGDILIKKEQEPPYWVINKYLDSLIVSYWPLKLYKVEVLDEKELYCIELNKKWGSNRYLHSFKISILEELSPFTLFQIQSQDNDKFSQLIDLAKNITLEQVDQLNVFSFINMEQLCEKVWDKWLGLSFEKTDRKLCSPIGYGLSLIDSLCYSRAQQLEGTNCYSIDEDGEIEIKPKWITVMHYLQCAAISYESYNILTKDEKLYLRNPIQNILNKLV